MDLISIQDIEDKYELSVLKEKARLFLKSNQVDKALRIFANILQHFPEDIDSLLVLGDAYLIIGNKVSAVDLFKKAFKILPERKDIRRRIELLESSGILNNAAVDFSPSHPKAISHLIHRLTGKLDSVTDKEIQRANNLLEDLLKNPSPAQAVADHLTEIDTLLPAFIKINIRQAQNEGNMELADSLQDLLTNLLVQRDLEVKQSPDHENLSQTKVVKIYIEGIDSQESPFRGDFIFQTIKDLGYEVYYAPNKKENLNLNNFDVVLARNPHGNKELIKRLAARAAVGLPIIMDFDVDYEQLPEQHPDFTRLGIHQEAEKRIFQTIKHMATYVSVPSEEFSKSLKREGIRSMMIPDGWNRVNFQWLKPPLSRSTINLGLFVLPGQVEEIAPYRRIITRVIREYAQCRLIIHGDLEVYHVFDGIPDNRKLFLPPADQEDFPYQLSQIDLMLFPRENSSFNNIRSDRLIMEAGVRRVPWVAPPIHPFLEWGTGGLLADNMDSWYAQITHLIEDRDLRTNLGKSGHHQALKRESKILGRSWSLLINEALVKNY
jgi:tetratricopeptide (TPR) repeat protein